MSKVCPICKFSTEDDDMVFCPECNHQDGKGEVRLRPFKPISSTKAVNLEGVAIDGDTVITVNVKEGDKIVHELSEAEKLRQNRALYHDKCTQYVKDGFISRESIRLLAGVRETLGLHKDIADHILEEVIEQSVRTRTILSDSEKISINAIYSAIKRNDEVAIQQSFKELKAYKQNIDIDEIDQLYYQLKAILTPEKFVEDFKSVHEQSYWELFWSYIALIKLNSDNAESSLSSLDKWVPRYPSNNQTIALTVGFLMRGRELDARSAFSQVGHGYSVELEPLYFALNELLDRDWRGEVFDVSPRAKFYVDALFKGIYNDLRCRAKETEAEILKEKQEIHQREIEIQHKKENFLLQYEKKDGDLGDALILSGISQLQFDNWKRTDADFNANIDAINKRIDEKKKEAERIAAEKRRRDEEVSKQMDDFKRAYKANDCNLQRTCTELNISCETVHQWRLENKSFDDSLLYLEDEYKKRKAAEERASRRAILKKLLPYILAGILLIIIGVGISMRIHYNEKDREIEKIENQKQIAIRSDYADKVNLFNEHFSKIKRTEDGIKEAKSALNILLEIKQIEIEKDTYIEKKYSIELTDELKRKCDELKDHFNGMRFSDDVFVKRDGQHLYNEIDNIRSVL